MSGSWNKGGFIYNMGEFIYYFCGVLGMLRAVTSLADFGWNPPVVYLVAFLCCGGMCLFGMIGNRRVYSGIAGMALCGAVFAIGGRWLGVQLSAAVNLLLASGCRRGELLGLKWDKVDWARKTIRIDCAMHYAPDRGLYEGPPTTRDSVRSIRLPQETMDLLRQYQRWQREEALCQGSRWQASPYIFTGEHGGPMNPSQLGNWLTRFEKRRGLPHLNPHAFRHTMTSLLLFSGVDSISVSHRLGHSSVATTTNIYGHIMQQAEDKISGRMEEIIARAKTEAADQGE